MNSPQRHTPVLDQWKIQIASIHGWADLKETCDEGKTYKTTHYPSQGAALEDLQMICSSDDQDNHRVVPSSTPANDDLY